MPGRVCRVIPSPFTELAKGHGRSKGVDLPLWNEQQAQDAAWRLRHSIGTRQGWLQTPSRSGTGRLVSPWFAFSGLW